MTDSKEKVKFIKRFQDFFYSNTRYILVSVAVFLTLFISIQIYSYYSIQNTKKISINFFNSLDLENNKISNLDSIKDSENFFSILSSLKLIQSYNDQRNFNLSNELYRNILSTNNLDKLYKSTIAIHATLTFIDASYIENTTNYISDIKYYLDSISDDTENFNTIKKELEYLLMIMRVDFDEIPYTNNNDITNLYNEILDSNIISQSTKERVKKIHEFHLYQ